MDICKMGTDSETILAECEMIQKQVPDPVYLVQSSVYVSPV